MNMIKKYPPAFYLALIFVISLHHCTDKTLGDFLATDFPPEVSECTFFGDLNQPDRMVRSSKDGEPWVICIWEQLSLIGTDSYPLTDNYILADDLDLAGGELPLIGDESSAFTGTFDGNGRSITNFQIPAEADAVIGYLPLGSYDENAVFIGIPTTITPEELCGRLVTRPPATAPILMNPHEPNGGNQLICQADQLIDAAAYIRTTEGLGEKYILVNDIDLAGGELLPIGDESRAFTGTFDGNGRSITNFRIPVGADAIIGYLLLGSYDADATFINIAAEMTPQQVCGRLVTRPPATAPILMNPHESNEGNRLICQEDQLSDTAAYIRTTTGLGEKYLLVSDVTLSGAFAPIGGSITGAFDGGGHTISGLMISTANNNIGFFGQIGSDAVVKNLNFQAPSVSFTGTGSANIGVLAGESSGRIENVNVMGNTARVQGNTSSTTGQNIGGLVGRQDGGTITGATASGDVSDGGDGSDLMGGLVGSQDGGTIENSEARGDVSQGGGDYDRMGGLVGWSVGMIVDSTASGNMSGGGIGNDFMGGLVGEQSGRGTITGATATGDVSDGGDGSDLMGGLVGEKTGGGPITSSEARGDVSQGGANIDYMGGLVGLQNGGQVENSTAMGAVSQGDDGVDYMGGLVGRKQSGTITNSTASGEVRNGGVGDDEMGGLVGWQENGWIENSTAMGDVSMGEDGRDSMGGLVGNCHGTITSSTAMGAVSQGGDDVDYMGGLVGQKQSGTIISSTATGAVSQGEGDSDSMGGLVGRQSNSGMIRNSTASGDVSQGGDASDNMGGLVGRQTTGTTIEDSIASGDVSDGGNAVDNMGGLVGFQSVPASKAQSSLSLGSVLNGGGGSNRLGGLIGEAVSGSSKTNLYWNTQTSGLTVDVGSGTCGSCSNQTTAQLIQATSFTGLNTPTSMPTAGPWDFGTTSQYPGLTFTSGDQTCTLRPVLTSAASTSTTTAAEFEICPDAEDADSFHPTCRAKPTGCPN